MLKTGNCRRRHDAVGSSSGVTWVVVKAPMLAQVTLCRGVREGRSGAVRAL